MSFQGGEGDSGLPNGVAAESLAGWSAIPRRLIATSRNVEWKSVLVDHHAVEAADCTLESRATPDQRLSLMLRGEQQLGSFNDGRWRTATFRAGTIGMTPGGKTDRLHFPKRRSPEPFETVVAYLPQALFREAREEYRRAGTVVDDRPLDTLAFDDPMLSHALLGLLQGVRTGAPDMYAQAVAQFMTTHLLATHSPWRSLVQEERQPGIITDRRLARVIEFMTAHSGQRLTLDQLAAEAGVSKFHFVRLFRDKTGLTPHAYLIDIRLEAGRRSLLMSDASITEVAAACGYSRATHFVTAFSRRFGLTPTELRRRHREGR